MLASSSNSLTNPEAAGIVLRTPSAGGVFANGALGAVGYVLGYFFTALILIWIVYSLYAAYKILLSQGAEQDLQKGYTLIKNVWISITWGMIFFVAISIIGSFTGIGDITQWYYQLAQCGGGTGSFYFQDIAAHQIGDVPTTDIYCCKVTANLKTAAEPYNNLSFKQDTYHYIGTDGAEPSAAYFSECTLFR